jgi:hypothetical protein
VVVTTDFAAVVVVVGAATVVVVDPVAIGALGTEGIVRTDTATVVVADGTVTGTVVGAATSITSAGATVVVVVVVVVVVGLTMSATRAVAALDSTVEPLALVAVTSNFRYLSMSSSVRVYVSDVAPVMLVYVPPAVAARFHRYVYVGAGYPDHVPRDPLSVCPLVVVPLTDGVTELAGAAGIANLMMTWPLPPCPERYANAPAPPPAPEFASPSPPWAPILPDPALVPGVPTPLFPMPLPPDP